MHSNNLSNNYTAYPLEVWESWNQDLEHLGKVSNLLHGQHSGKPLFKFTPMDNLE